MRPLAFVAGIALVIMGAVGIGTYLIVAGPSDPGGPTGAAQPSPSIRFELTEAEKQQALDLMVGDSRFQEIVGDNPYTVGTVAMWHAEGDPENVFGAGIFIALNPPVSFPVTDWLDVRYDATDPASYTTTTVPVGIDDVTEITVFVDFTKGVVGIQPSEGGEMHIPPGFTPVPKPPSYD